MNKSARAQALTFAEQLAGSSAGYNAMLDAVSSALNSDAEAIVVVSDGLAGPNANAGRNLNQITAEIRGRNAGGKQIHTVLLGDFLNYRSDVLEFMERLAKENHGQFMALLP